MKIVTAKAHSAITDAKGLSLNLGAGNSVLEGYLSVDLREFETTDIVADLNGGLPLIPDSSVERIFSRHTLEHISALDLLFEEIMRVCVRGATIKVIVPHYSNPFGYSDPTHVRFFGIYSFCYYASAPYFQLRNRFPRYNKDICLAIESVRISFYRLTRWDRFFVPIFERWINGSRGRQEFYEYRLSRILPAHEIVFILRVVK